MATTTRNTNFKTAGDEANEAANSVANEATEATRHAADKASDVTKDAANKAADVSKRATDKAVEAGNEALNTAQESLRETSARTERFISDTQRTVTEQFGKFSKGFEGLSSFSQENIDAFVKSSEIAAKAAEGIGSEITAYSKKAFEDGVAAAQDLATARTLTELFEKQSAYTQTALEGWVHQATKLNEIYIAAAKDISAPIGRRMSAASEAFRGFNA